MTPKQGEQKQDREGEQGLPRLLGSDDAPVVPVIEEGGKPQQVGDARPYATSIALWGERLLLGFPGRRVQRE